MTYNTNKGNVQMILRILVMLGLIVLAGGFIFFAANVIWLGTKEFFAKYGPSSKKDDTMLSKDNDTNNANK